MSKGSKGAKPELGKVEPEEVLPTPIPSPPKTKTVSYKWPEGYLPGQCSAETEKMENKSKAVGAASLMVDFIIEESEIDIFYKSIDARKDDYMIDRLFSVSTFIIEMEDLVHDHGEDPRVFGTEWHNYDIEP